MEDSLLARAFITMWNNHFAPTIYKREDGIEVKLNVVKMFNWNPANFNSNAKLNINQIEPNVNFFILSQTGLKISTSIWLNDQPTNKWIVGVHGFNSTRIDVLYLLWHYRDLGYNIITFDHRNHGNSDRDFVTWGYKEKVDLSSVIEWLIKSYKVDEIGLVGTSMGAFTLNYFILTEQDLIKRSHVCWAVSDSGYMAVPSLLNRLVINNSPKFLGKVSNNILSSIIGIYKNEYGIDFNDLDFAKIIKPNHKYVPILYIHNRYDRITDYLDSFRMCEIKNNMESSNDNEILILDGKHHTKSLIEYPEEYKKISLKFVKKHQIKSK